MSAVRRIESDPNFRRLAAERLRLGLRLSSAMFVAYFGYILCIAFWPQLLGTPLAEGAATTWGVLVGVLIIALGFALTAIYVRVANTRFDRLNADILEDVR
jgi:uncharacterized membrane protein (DUF485 family)